MILGIIKKQDKFYKQAAAQEAFSILICLLLRLNKKTGKIFGMNY